MPFECVSRSCGLKLRPFVHHLRSMMNISTIDYEELLSRQGNATSGAQPMLPSDLIIHIVASLTDTELRSLATASPLFLALYFQREYRALTWRHFNFRKRTEITVSRIQ